MRALTLIGVLSIAGDASAQTVSLPSTPEVVLYGDAGIGWAVVCRAPCTARLPPFGLYHVNGPGIRRSEPFHLTAAPGTRHLSVTASPFAPWMGAIVAQYLGWTVISGGIVMMSMSKFVYDHDGGDPFATFGTINGFLSIVAGTVAVAWSIWIFATHKPSTVRIE